MTEIEISSTLKLLRKEHKMSQEQLAEKIGLPRQLIASWENTRSMPTAEDLEKLGQVYGMDLSTLVVTPKAEPDKKEKDSARRMMFLNLGMIGALIFYVIMFMITGTYYIDTMGIMLLVILGNQIVVSVLAWAGKAKKIHFLPAAPKTCKVDGDVFEDVISRSRMYISVVSCIFLWVTAIQIFVGNHTWFNGLIVFGWLAGMLECFIGTQKQSMNELVLSGRKTAQKSLRQFQIFAWILLVILAVFWIWFTIMGTANLLFDAVILFVLVAADLLWYVSARHKLN